MYVVSYNSHGLPREIDILSILVERYEMELIMPPLTSVKLQVSLCCNTHHLFSKTLCHSQYVIHSVLLLTLCSTYTVQVQGVSWMITY